MVKTPYAKPMVAHRSKPKTLFCAGSLKILSAAICGLEPEPTKKRALRLGSRRIPYKSYRISLQDLVVIMAHVQAPGILLEPEDPTNNNLWNARSVGPWNENAGSLCLCGLLGPCAIEQAVVRIREGPNAFEASALQGRCLLEGSKYPDTRYVPQARITILRRFHKSGAPNIDP